MAAVVDEIAPSWVEDDVMSLALALVLEQQQEAEHQHQHQQHQHQQHQHQQHSKQEDVPLPWWQTEQSAVLPVASVAHTPDAGANDAQIPDLLELLAMPMCWGLEAGDAPVAPSHTCSNSSNECADKWALSSSPASTCSDDREQMLSDDGDFFASSEQQQQEQQLFHGWTPETFRLCSLLAEDQVPLSPVSMDSGNFSSGSAASSPTENVLSPLSLCVAADGHHAFPQGADGSLDMDDCLGGGMRAKGHARSSSTSSTNSTNSTGSTGSVDSVDSGLGSGSESAPNSASKKAAVVAPTLVVGNRRGRGRAATLSSTGAGISKPAAATATTTATRGRRAPAKAAAPASSTRTADSDEEHVKLEANDEEHVKLEANDEEHVKLEFNDEHDDHDDETSRAAMNSDPANFPPISAFLARPLAAHDAVRAAVENRNTTTEMDLHLLSVTDPVQLRRAGLNLTKLEERELKHLRRRLKNKLAAAESRRKKKNYVAGLEKRIQDVSTENAQLQQRLAAMEAELCALRAENQSLKEAQTASHAGGSNKRQRLEVDADHCGDSSAASNSLVAHFSGHAQSQATALSRAVKARSSYVMIFALTFGLLHSWIGTDSVLSGTRSLFSDVAGASGADAADAPISSTAAASAPSAAEPRPTLLRSALLNMARSGKAPADASAERGFVARRILQHDAESAMEAGDYLMTAASLEISPLELDGNITYFHDFSDDSYADCGYGGDDIPAAIADDVFDF